MFSAIGRSWEDLKDIRRNELNKKNARDQKKFDQGSPSSSTPITNIVLVGRSGDGISTTGNTLLGQKMFSKGGAFMNCQMFSTATTDGQIINVIKTPGMFDLSVSEDKISKEIINCLTMVEEGLHAVLFVLSVRNRISQEEEYALNTLQRIFGSLILNYLIFVLTDGEKFEAVEFEDYFRESCPEFLRSVVRVCGGRKVLFSNMTNNEGVKAEQVNQIMAHVASIRKQNGWEPYTDKLHRNIKRGQYLVDLFKPKNNESALMANHERVNNLPQVPVQFGPPHTLSEPIKNIVLVGRTGNGKSATGNTLLGETMFNSALQAEGVTMECKMYRAAILDGPIINVIDTPGLFDLSVPAEYISTEIVKCLTMAEGGIHAVLYVLSVGNRITKEEESTLDTLQVIFESKILDYLILVFTGGDRLEANNQTLDDYFRAGYPEFIKRALRLCGGRMVLFNNMTKNKIKKAEQVNELLAHVVAIENNNGGKPYTDKMHRNIKEEGEKFRKQQRKADSNNLAAEMAVMKENLELEYDEKMRRMAQLLERKLQKSAEAHEKTMQQMRDALENY